MALCLLSGAACVQTVAEQMNAPEHITPDSFQAESGLSAFLIGAQVHVPSVDCLSTYEYHTVPATEDVLQNAADALERRNITIAPFDDISQETTHSLSECNATVVLTR